MCLHREATHLMNLESLWNPELGENDGTLDTTKQAHMDPIKLKGDIDIFYKYGTTFFIFIINVKLKIQKN